MGCEGSNHIYNTHLQLSWNAPAFTFWPRQNRVTLVRQMAFCLAELHLLSTKSSLQVKDTDIGTYQYYDKGEPANLLEHHYYNEKLQFSEARGYSWTPVNRRPERLRDSLKELEELLQTNTCLHTRWRNKHCCQLILGSGILVTLTLSGLQLEQVCIDRVLVGRLPGDTLTGAVLSDRLILLSFLKQSQVAAVFLSKKNQDSQEAGRDTDKLSASEIKVKCVELSGWAHGPHQGVALNRLQDVALCWWRCSEQDEEQLPWAPANVHRNNLVLLSCSPSEGLQVLSSSQTEGDLLDCSFSQLQPYHLLTVEAPAGPQASKEGSWAKSSVFECQRGRLHRLSVTRIPLPSHPISCSRHPNESALLLGLSDASLVLYDQRRGVSLLASCLVPPTLLAWHPAGAMAMAGAAQGELMCFDVGLAPLSMALVAEEVAPMSTLQLAQHLRCPGGLQRLQWATGPEGGDERADTLMLAFHGGPLASLGFRLGALTGGQMGPGELLQQRLHCGQVREALSILEAMDWSIMGDECFRGLSSITNHLLRLPLDAQTEAQLEATLGVFYAPSTPLPGNVMLDYKEPISRYARRFFHHLLRYERFEKAFLLSIDLQAKDLFMDLHYVARDKGEVVLAEVAKRKACEMEARTLGGDGEEIITMINPKDIEVCSSNTRRTRGVTERHNHDSIL
ncbi:WD repeat-containing and planar cell polarity effector protein fritz homolog isoform X3 [Dunckerocampus dactyliophorus]|uniref:WD repeat-containing and planar cell polarity effector protein fritz homolog isoform X3 n=1 Tax=Dunckerocampus dactyliophorus TaxID=161453 RepID=UPI002406233A|nr:WD repeat-containing and planar cell polarity effector protein fritz homolog isoform X3 [Dunckerocampus dactyliophorus]